MLLTNFLQNRHVAPWDTGCLTPAKLATFYRLVGGDYDPLFLDTSPNSLSFIYQSLGCFHTLQPDKDPYNKPIVPALTPQGFVRWQTVQLLLEPDEHVPFLQEAVKRFEITNPLDGEPFPSVLPNEVLPNKPDQEMTEWHDSVSEKLMLEAKASQERNLPPRPPMALSDGDLESLRPSSADSLSIESQSLMDATSYFQHPRTYGSSRVPPRPDHSRRLDIPYTRRGPPQASGCEAPWSPLRRRSSMPAQEGQQHYPASWPNGNSTPRSRHRSRPHRRHARTPSTISTESFTSDSSLTSSSASESPIIYHAQPQFGFPPGQSDRRHSTHLPRPELYARSQSEYQRQPSAPPQKFKWQSMDKKPVMSQHNGDGFPEEHRDRPARSADGRHMLGREQERVRGARSLGPTNGGRRRLAGEGW